MSVRYYIPELDHEPEDAWSFELPRPPSDKLDAAELAADDYHRCHDGWEHKHWPIVFMVAWRTDRPNYFDAVSVEREATPVFIARGI